MSGTSGPKEPIDEVVHHASLTPEKPGVSRALSDHFRLDTAGDGLFSSESPAQTGAEAPSTLPENGHLVDIAGMEGGRHAALDMGKDAWDREDIERQASEHLARRATEMSLNDDVGESHGSGHVPDAEFLTQAAQLSQKPVDTAPAQIDTKAKKPVLEEAFDEKHPPPPNEETGNDIPEAPKGMNEATGAEILNIMDQFEEGGLPEDAIMSPRLERQQSMLVLPPRSSSLEAQPNYTISPQNSGQSGLPQTQISPQETGNSIASNLQRVKTDDSASISSARAGTLFQPPPPSPEPEPALPFDFHRFLEQLRNKSADPVARYLRSFLQEFGKKQWMVHEQVKIISDFLEFISRKMGQCEVWRTVSDAEFDNAREGMEKLVMNRLYSYTFSPAIPSPMSSPRKGRSGRSQADQVSPHGPGRRGQHQEDVERDEVIAQKIKIYGWIREEHLDIKPLGPKGEKFFTLAQQELLKINSYRAPRDKVICVLNCCKVIFGFLKNSKADQSADAFVPLLIYTVLRAHPPHLVSNVQYIWRFRNQEKLGGEAGYYMSSLMGVVTFIENLDRTNLTISDEEFEKNVEQAVSAIAEKNRKDDYEDKSYSASVARPPPQHLDEKSAISRPEVTPRTSMEAEQSTPRRHPSTRSIENPVRTSNSSNDDGEDGVTGLLRSIQKPLSSIGRMFTDEVAPEQQTSRTARGLSPAARSERASSARPRRSAERPQSQHQQGEEAAARQASAEVAQAQALRVREHQVVVETLQSMFPNLDRELIEDVVRSQEGNVGRAVDACLALSG